VIQAASAQTASQWGSAVSGSWSDATKWSPAVMPNNGSPTADDTYDVTLNATGSAYTVTGNVAASINSLTLNSADATLLLQNTLTLNGPLNIQAGTFRVTNGGTIDGGSINVSAGATLAFASGNLRNTTLTGVASVPSEQTLILRADATLSNGTITLNAASGRTSDLWLNRFPDHGLLGGTGEIVFNGVGSNFVRSMVGNMVIESGITIRSGTNGGRLEMQDKSKQIINYGTISAQTAGTTVELADFGVAGVTNHGTFAASNGGKLIVNGLNGNAGTLSLGSGSTIELLGNNFTVNQGFTLGSGTTLKLIGGFSVTAPITANAGSTLGLGGSWSNAAAVTVNGATLELVDGYARTGTGAFSVTNATVNFNGGGFLGASLQEFMIGGNAVTLKNTSGINNTGYTISLSNATGSLTMVDGSIFSGAITASGSAKINVTGWGHFYKTFIDTDVHASSGSNVRIGSLFAGNAGLSTINRTITGTNANVTLDSEWRNDGLISLTGGTLDLRGTIQNLGDIQLNGTNLVVKTTLTTAQLESIWGANNPAIIDDQGIIDNTGDVLEINDARGAFQLASGGIRNGTILTGGSARTSLAFGQGHLFDVTLDADQVSVPISVTAHGRLTLMNTTVLLYDDDVEFHRRNGLYFFAPTTGVDGTGEVVFAGVGSSHAVSNGGLLNIGSGITIRTETGSGWINGESSELINQGTVRAIGTDKFIHFRDFQAFTNRGRLEAINGGQLRFGGTNLITQGYLYNWTNEGVIHLENGSAVVIGQTFTNAESGVIEGTGTLDVSGTTFINDGYVSPGLSPGTLTISGNYTQGQTGVLRIELGGAGAGQSDKLIITGNASLDGTLEIVLANGYIPDAGAAFQFLSAGSLSGGFDNAGAIIELPEGTMELSFSGGVFSVSGFVSAFELGDFNLDGSTTNVDIQAMLDALTNVEAYKTAHGLSESGFKLVGDIDANGSVSNADIQSMLDLLTSGGGMSVQQIALEVFGDEHFLDTYAASVPEPASLGLLAVGGLTALRRRRSLHD
jgi:hypothetical protein